MPPWATLFVLLVGLSMGVLGAVFFAASVTDCALTTYYMKER